LSHLVNCSFIIYFEGKGIEENKDGWKDMKKWCR